LTGCSALSPHDKKPKKAVEKIFSMAFFLSDYHRVSAIAHGLLEGCSPFSIEQFLPLKKG
jgi:hypothetical protein